MIQLFLGRQSSTEKNADEPFFGYASNILQDKPVQINKNLECFNIRSPICI